MCGVDAVFDKFLRMAVNMANPVSHHAPLRFIIGRINLPRHLSGGTMPHQNRTMDLADLEKTQTGRRRRSTRRRIQARTTHREPEAMKRTTQLLATHLATGPQMGTQMRAVRLDRTHRSRLRAINDNLAIHKPTGQYH